MTTKDYIKLITLKDKHEITAKLVLWTVSQLDPKHKYYHIEFDPVLPCFKSFSGMMDKDYIELVEKRFKRIETTIKRLCIEDAPGFAASKQISDITDNMYTKFMQVVCGLYIEIPDFENYLPKSVLEKAVKCISEERYLKESNKFKSGWRNRYTGKSDKWKETREFIYKEGLPSCCGIHIIGESGTDSGIWYLESKRRFTSEELVAGWMFEYSKKCPDNEIVREFLDSTKVDYTPEDLKLLISRGGLKMRDNEIDNINEVFNNKETLVNQLLHENINSTPTYLVKLMRTLFLK